MKSRSKVLFLFLFILFLNNTKNIQAQTLEVTFSGIRSEKGQLILKIYSTEKEYEDDKPIKTLYYTKSTMQKGFMIAKFSLEPGTYGMAMLDDENNDKEMNYNFVGMPKEGFGFSNYYLSGLFKPKFEVFKFNLGQNQTQKIQMKIRYI